MSSSPLPRTSLAATCLGHAAVLGGAAAVLPWRSGTLFALILTLLALLHVATGVTALLKKPEWLLHVWRALSVASAVAFLVVGWSMAAAAIYVAKLYLRLGPSVAGGIVAAGVLFALLTVPMAIWGARYTWPARFRSTKRLGIGAGIASGVFVLTLPLAGSAAQSEPVRLVDSRFSSRLSDELESFVHEEPNGMRRSVAGAGPAVCKYPLDTERITVLVAFAARNGGVRSLCLQSTDGRVLIHKVSTELERRGRPGSSVVVDVVKAVKPLKRRFPLLDTLEVRPGIDGICEEQRRLWREPPAALHSRGQLRLFDRVGAQVARLGAGQQRSRAGRPGAHRNREFCG